MPGIGGADSTDELEDAIARIAKLEAESHSKPGPTRDYRLLISIIVATIGLATPLTTLIVSDANENLLRIKDQQEIELKKLSLKQQLQEHYVDKATDGTDEAQRLRVLRFILRLSDSELQAWAKVEHDLSVEQLEKQKQLEKIRVQKLEKELSDLKSRKTSDKISKNKLSDSVQQLEAAVSNVKRLETVTQPEPTIELTKLVCKNAQTWGGRVDEIAIVADGIQVWSDKTCGGKTGKQGQSDTQLGERIGTTGRCARIELFEIDPRHNDSMGFRTVCASSGESMVLFQGSTAAGKFHYELHFETSTKDPDSS